MKNIDIKSSAAKGFLWVSLYIGGMRVIQVVTYLILGYLLEPVHFGTFDLAMVLVLGLIMLREIGLTPALIQMREDVEQAFNNAALLLPVFGAIVFIVIYLIAPIYGRAASNQEVVPIVRVLGLIAPISALGILPAVYLQRNLLFKKKIFPEIISVAAGSGLSVLLAFKGHGVWSFVFGVLTTELLRTILYWITVGWIFKPQVDFAMWKRLLTFGIQVSLGSIFGFLYSMVDRFAVGSRFSAEKLGFYSFPFHLANLLPNNLILISNQLILPTLSSFQDDDERYIRTYITGVSLFVLIATPICAGIYFFGGDMLHWIYSDKWDKAFLALKIFAVYGFSQAIGAINTEVFFSKGKPKYFTLMTGSRLLICILAVPFIVKLGKMEAIAALFTFTLLGITIYSFIIAAKLMNIRLTPVCIIFIPHIISIVLGQAAVYFIPGSILFLRIGVFFAVYAGAQFIFNRKLMSDIKGFIKLILRKENNYEG